MLLNQSPPNSEVLSTLTGAKENHRCPEALSPASSPVSLKERKVLLACGKSKWRRRKMRKESSLTRLLQLPSERSEVSPGYRRPCGQKQNKTKSPPPPHTHTHRKRGGESKGRKGERDRKEGREGEREGSFWEAVEIVQRVPGQA